MSLYTWLTLPIGLLGIGLICFYEYRSQLIVTRYQLQGHQADPEDKEFIEEIADFQKTSAKVAVMSITVSFTALYFVLTKEFGLWAFIPLTALILAVAMKLLPMRIMAIRRLKRAMNRQPVTPPSPSSRQISPHIIIDSD